MPPRRRTVCWLAVAIVVAANVTGGPAASAPGSHREDRASRLVPSSPWPGALRAVLRTEADRLEGTRAENRPSSGRLLPLIAVSLFGGLLPSPRRPRRALRGPARALGARLCQRVGLRAPPSSALA